MINLDCMPVAFESLGMSKTCGVSWLTLITVDVLNLMCCVCGCGPCGRTISFCCTYCVPVCGVAYHHVRVSSGCLVLPLMLYITVFCFVEFILCQLLGFVDLLLCQTM